MRFQRVLSGASSGVAAVECALILIPLLLAVSGIIDAGYILKRTNLALHASRAAARAESIAAHTLIFNAPAPLSCGPVSCAATASCAGTSFNAAHQAACAYLSAELGGQFAGQDWLVEASASEILDAQLGLPAPADDDPVRRAVRVTVRLDPQVKPCIVCFLGHFLNTGVVGESTYLLHR